MLFLTLDEPSPVLNFYFSGSSPYLVRMFPDHVRPYDPSPDFGSRLQTPDRGDGQPGRHGPV